MALDFPSDRSLHLNMAAVRRTKTSNPRCLSRKYHGSASLAKPERVPVNGYRHEPLRLNTKRAAHDGLGPPPAKIIRAGVDFWLSLRPFADALWLSGPATDRTDAYSFVQSTGSQCGLRIPVALLGTYGPTNSKVVSSPTYSNH